MSKNSDDSMVFIAGTLLGVITGILAGLVLSPRPGKEIRQEIIKKVSTDSMLKVKYSLESQMNKINKALQAGKLAAAKEKEEAESGY